MVLYQFVRIILFVQYVCQYFNIVTAFGNSQNNLYYCQGRSYNSRNIDDCTVHVSSSSSSPTTTTLYGRGILQQQLHLLQQQVRNRYNYHFHSQLYLGSNGNNNSNNSNNNDIDIETAQIIEETRLKVLQNRRQQIRQTLQAAERVRNYRLQQIGDVPIVLDPITGQPIKDNNSSNNNKMALSITAFIVTVGAIVLRVGGRTALISVVGLDFLSDSPELKENLDLILQTTNDMEITTKLFVFIFSWIFVKVFCFDAGGVVLALSSGILFNGVLNGAILSATAATIGSSVAFTLAKLDTPIRAKALSLLEEYPSLRGIERVVARDGIKAILTLRLAPILPIPIGMYSYIYGVTNVPIIDFVCGIFIGSMKPYLLDSYLGYFGKEIIQGVNPNDNGLQDYILLGALGFSILIGVFASQLASETWDSVIQEVEAEKKSRDKDGINDETKDGIVRTIFGMNVPEWIIGFQLGIQNANERITNLIEIEQNAQVWNYTTNINESKRNGIPLLPPELDPANFINSPERLYKNQGLDIGQDFCNGLVLSPLLFSTFMKYSDPSYNHTTAIMETATVVRNSTLHDNDEKSAGSTVTSSAPVSTIIEMDTGVLQELNVTVIVKSEKESQQPQQQSPEQLLQQLSALRTLTEKKLIDLDDQLRQQQQKDQVAQESSIGPER